MCRSLIVFLTFIHVIVATLANVPQKSSTPNIIFILMDDIGFADLSATGAEYNTPNLDKLYNNAIHLNRHYVGLLCSPSRSQILTGRYAFYFGLSSYEPFFYQEITAVPSGFPTIANLLQSYANYSTYVVGKWHTGYSTWEHTPLWRGFDEFYGFMVGGVDYWNKSTGPPGHDGAKTRYIDWWANNTVDYETRFTFSTFVQRDRAIEVINKQQDGENAFYMYLAFEAPHETLEKVSSSNDDTCEDLIDINPQRYLYCLNIVAVDESIGAIMDTLKNNSLWDNTLIVFTSDNGGEIQDGGCNYPLRGNKGVPLDGGVRTLAFVGGGYIDAKQRGSTRNKMMHSVDWLPTLLSIAGINMKQVIDDLNKNIYSSLPQSAAGSTTGDIAVLDGYDISNWILYNESNINNRTNVALSVNTPDSDYETAIVFISNITGHLYKLMQFKTAPPVNQIGWCDYCTFNGTRTQCVWMEYPTQSTDFLFDLSLDARETNNLVSNWTHNGTDSRSRFDTYTKVVINEMKEYYFGLTSNEVEEGEDVISQIWKEGQEIIAGYRHNALFGPYLECSFETFTNESDPGNLPLHQWQPFFTFEEYVEAFNQTCGSVTSPPLYKLYTTLYSNYTVNV